MFLDIDMEKAKEIQRLWKSAVGDFFLEYEDPAPPDDIAHGYYGDWKHKCLGSDDDQLLHLYSASDKMVWLPSQAQLQEIFRKFIEIELEATEPNTKGAFLEFAGWLGKQYEESKFICVPTNLFDSGEQLWLAFVMQERYKKKWNGEDWIETKL
jgi:hypothetical protein